MNPNRPLSDQTAKAMPTPPRMRPAQKNRTPMIILRTEPPTGDTSAPALLTLHTLPDREIPAAKPRINTARIDT